MLKVCDHCMCQWVALLACIRIAMGISGDFKSDLVYTREPFQHLSREFIFLFNLAQSNEHLVLLLLCHCHGCRRYLVECKSHCVDDSNTKIIEEREQNTMVRWHIAWELSNSHFEIEVVKFNFPSHSFPLLTDHRNHYWPMCWTSTMIFDTIVDR